MQLILSLSDRKKPPWITICAFYVFISRVRRAASLRLLKRDDEAIRKLQKLRHDDFLYCWEQGSKRAGTPSHAVCANGASPPAGAMCSGYDAEGRWSDERAETAWKRREQEKKRASAKDKEEKDEAGKRKRAEQVQERRAAAKEAKRSKAAVPPQPAPSRRPVPVEGGKRRAVEAEAGGSGASDAAADRLGHAPPPSPPPSPPSTSPPSVGGKRRWTRLGDYHGEPRRVLQLAGDVNDATDGDTVCRLSVDEPSVSHLSVESGVGVGKSTCLAALAGRYAHDPAVIVLPEPVDAWREHGLLQRMYANEMTKLEFQLVALATIAGPLAEALRRPDVRLVITERSPLSSWRVFAKLNLRGADMVAFELAYAAVERMLPERREATVYLCLDAATTKERIARRGRAEEGVIDEGFIHALTERHEDMFGALSHSKHRVDAAGSPAEVAAAVLAVAESMLQPHRSGHAAVGSHVSTPARSPVGIAIDVGAGSPLVIEDLDSPIATAAEPAFAPGLPLAAVTSAWDEAANAWEAQRVASSGAITYERQCAVCRRTLASRLRQYGSHLYFESVEQLCYDQHDGPPLGFCGARCHRLYQPWIDVMEDCVSDMGVDYAGLECAAEEARDDCRRKLRAARLFVGVGRAIGRLLLLRRRIAEARCEVGGGEGGEGEAGNRPWAPKDTKGLLHAIATMDYGVSDDRSSKLATPAIKAYNARADRYHQVLQKRGQPLHEGFTIVKVEGGEADGDAVHKQAL